MMGNDVAMLFDMNLCYNAEYEVLPEPKPKKDRKKL